MSGDENPFDGWADHLDVPSVDLDALQGASLRTDEHDAAVTLARIRAVGDAPVTSDAVSGVIARAAGVVDRELVELGTAAGTRRLVLGWVAGAGPDPGQHPSARPRTLPPTTNVVWAVCLAAAWPDPALDPWPGNSVELEDVHSACRLLGVNSNRVVHALDAALPQSGLIQVADSRIRLGRAAAAMPGTVWSALRRFHDRLPHEAVRMAIDQRASVTEVERLAPFTPVARRIPRQNVGAVEERDDLIAATVTALEAAREPVAESDLPGLRDPVHRSSVKGALAACGRTLVRTPVGRWTTSYSEDAAAVLVAERTGTLQPLERAVLALVLLHTIAIPRAKGRLEGNDWTSTDHPVTFETLLNNRKTFGSQFQVAIRRLRAAGYVESGPTAGYVPGPAMARLSDSAREDLWEDLVLLARPDGYLAERIRARREQQVSGR